MPTFQFESRSNEPMVMRPHARHEPPPRLLILPLSGLNINDSDMVTAFHDEISLYLANLSTVALVSRGSSEKFGQIPTDLPHVIRAS